MARKKKSRFGGWQAYRYGEAKQPVSLKRIFVGEQKEHVVERTISILKGWHNSPFENEGACTAGLRSALCLVGHGWGEADLEASLIVAEGLSLMSAVRPSWVQGQPEYVTPREDCRHCAGPMPADAFVGRRQPFYCSEVCARSAVQGRINRQDADYNRLINSARATIYRAKCKPRICLHCQGSFRPEAESKKQKYCSTVCYYNAHLAAPPQFACKCVHCGADYFAKVARSIYCSKICLSRVYEKRRPARVKPGKVIYLTAEIFDGWFKSAA